jgi:hypothetical protein
MKPSPFREWLVRKIRADEELLEYFSELGAESDHAAAAMEAFVNGVILGILLGPREDDVKL